MPPDRGNPSIHVTFSGVPQQFHFCCGLCMIACFMNALYTCSKNHADSEYGSQFALKATLE